MKFKFLVIDEDGDVTGINDEALAVKASEWNIVVNCETAMTVEPPDQQQYVMEIPVLTEEDHNTSD